MAEANLLVTTIPMKVILSMETSFDLNLINPPFKLHTSIDNLVQIFTIDNCNSKQSIIYESIYFIIATVKYYNKKGKRTM